MAIFFQKYCLLNVFGKILNNVRIFEPYLKFNLSRYKFNYLKSLSRFDQLSWLSNFKRSSVSIASSNFFNDNKYKTKSSLIKPIINSSKTFKDWRISYNEETNKKNYLQVLNYTSKKKNLREF